MIQDLFFPRVRITNKGRQAWKCSTRCFSVHVGAILMNTWSRKTWWCNKESNITSFTSIGVHLNMLEVNPKKVHTVDGSMLRKKPTPGKSTATNTYVRRLLFKLKQQTVWPWGIDGQIGRPAWHDMGLIKARPGRGLAGMVIVADRVVQCLPMGCVSSA